MRARKLSLHIWVLAIAVTLLGQMALSQNAYSQEHRVASWASGQQHPNDAGYKGMTDAVDQKLFAAKK